MINFSERIDLRAAKQLSQYKEQKEEAKKNASISSIRSNVVDQKTLREVQLKVMGQLKEYLAHTFGPMGSNSMILQGNTVAALNTKYTKDGHNVLSKIQYDNPIENTICKELESITGHVEHVVGDGTTSAVELSATIFEYLDMLMNTSLKGQPPYEVIRRFKIIVEEVQKKILESKRDITLDDIYNICMTSTNGDTDVSDMITQVYQKFGFDVDISVGISNDTSTKLKSYDGLVLNEPYSDPAYINRADNGTCELHNPRIYAFQDPVDTPEMVSLFEKIVYDNIILPINEDRTEDIIPTVILTTKFSRDASPLIIKLVSVLNQYIGVNASQKPPILIVTNITTVDEGVYQDITKLCGVPLIRKYIDPEIQKHDQETGMAPTLETVGSFCGQAEMVVADSEKTKFVNPKNMYDKDGNESVEYRSLMEWLKSELASAQNNNESIGTIAALKKRIRAIGGNMVEYLIGGIDVADRDSKRDLVIDAVKNCKSAALNGVGEAANFEALIAIGEIYDDLDNHDDTQVNKMIDTCILEILYASYFEVIKGLYMSIMDEESAVKTIETAMEKHCALNLYTREYDGKVCCSIDLDIKILDAISKIVTVMATSNQCILQAPGLNCYN